MALDGIFGWTRKATAFSKVAIAKFGNESGGQLYFEPMTAAHTAVTEGKVSWDGAANGLAQSDATVVRHLVDRVIAKDVCLLTTHMRDHSFFIADRAYKVTAVRYVATTPESGGTLAMEINKCTAVEAPASGVLVTAAAADMVGAALVTQTVYSPALSATAADLLLAAGDRLALDFTGDTAGELADLCIEVVLDQV